MMELLSDPAVWASLATLTVMEVVLGIDNIVFISIISTKLPEHQQGKARLIGLILACVTRFLLLLTISFIMELTKPLFEISGHPVAGRDLILLVGGAFLVYKATKEIHEKLEGHDEARKDDNAKVSFSSIITQIVLLDIIFSLDSVITAVGMSEHLPVMMAAVIIALAFMLFVGRPISDFVLKHPTVKMLALSFLLLIGVSLAAEAFHKEIPKGYIYAAMAFSVFVEMLNLWVSKRKAAKKGVVAAPVHLRQNVVGLNISSSANKATK